MIRSFVGIQRVVGRPSERAEIDGQTEVLKKQGGAADRIIGAARDPDARAAVEIYEDLGQSPPDLVARGAAVNEYAAESVAQRLEIGVVTDEDIVESADL